MLTITDVETSFQITERGDYDGSPFNPGNNLVSIGWRCSNHAAYRCVKHLLQPSDFSREELQAVLDETTLLVGHNIKFDLVWLKECDFRYTGAIADTMIIEYVFARGQKLPLDLSSCCSRYGLPVKDDKVKALMDKGVSPERIEWELLKSYGIQDIDITWELFHKQLETMGVTWESLRWATV